MRTICLTNDTNKKDATDLIDLDMEEEETTSEEEDIESPRERTGTDSIFLS